MNLCHSKSFITSFLVMLCLGLFNAKRLRLPIPKSLVVLDSSGIDVINDAVLLTEKSGIFADDHNFVKRIAIVEAALNNSSKEGGLWNIDKCAFVGVTQNRRKYRRLVGLQKRVRKTYGITWSRIRHYDLRRPIYSVLAVRLYLEIAMPNIPRRLRSQAQLFSQEYHKCADLSSGRFDPRTQAWREGRFMRVVKKSCNSGYNKCAHFCHELPQGRTDCSCRNGFTLLPNGKDCEPLREDRMRANISDPIIYKSKRDKVSADQAVQTTRGTLPPPTPGQCHVNRHKCEHSCERLPRGRMRCTCRKGFKKHSNGYSCVDVNECKRLKSPCHHICRNTPGSFYCSCRRGYRLKSDKKSCKAMKRKCSPNDLACINRRRCRGPGCTKCPPGKKPRTDGKRGCVRVDQCALYKGVCHHNCVNTAKGYRCTCKKGYKLNKDGVSCYDVNECNEGLHGCQHRCLNVPGGYFCSCTKGFRLDKNLKSCVDIDECALYLGICKQPSKCRNTIGGYNCTCPKGFVSHRDEVCIDEDECKTNNGGCKQKCENLPGSYRCSCFHGYVLQKDRKTCQDIDECKRYYGLCYHRCINIPGGYKCVCPPGQRQHFNGLFCM